MDKGSELIYIKSEIEEVSKQYYFEPTWEGKITFRLLAAASSLILAAANIQRDGIVGSQPYTAEKTQLADASIQLVKQYLSEAREDV